MEIVFQFPVIDLRQVTQPGKFLDLWPPADITWGDLNDRMARKPFIRGFGRIQSSVEGYYCNINCVRYNNLHEKGFPFGDTHKASIIHSHKLLYSDSNYTKKAELGFQDNIEAAATQAAPKEPLNLSDVLKHYALLSIDIQGAATRICDAGSKLAEVYAQATTSHHEEEILSDDMVTGEPCIALSFVRNSHIHMPAPAEKIEELAVDGNMIGLYGYKWNCEGHGFKVWLFELPHASLLHSAKVTTAISNKVSHLFRVNAEKETVRMLVALGEANDPASKRYVKKTAQKIFKKERFSNDQSATRDFALQNFERGEEKPATKEGIKKVADDDALQGRGQDDATPAAAAPPSLTIDDIKKLLDDYTVANLKALTEKGNAKPSKKTVLFITSNPTDSTPIKFDQEFREIQKELKAADDREYFEVDIQTAVERDTFMDILSANAPDYLHITLHASKTKGLYFQDAQNNEDPMDVEEFTDYIKLLTKKKRPQVIVLSACNSLPHAQAVKDYCGHVMGTNLVFPDDAAVIYAKKFYGTLFNGNADNIAYCHQRAVLAIKHHNPPFDAIETNEVYDIPKLIPED